MFDFIWDWLVGFLPWKLQTGILGLLALLVAVLVALYYTGNL